LNQLPTADLITSADRFIHHEEEGSEARHWYVCEPLYMLN